MDQNLKIFRITPKDPSDRNWEASTHKGVVLVRAKDLKNALALCRGAFLIATRVKFAEKKLVNPWNEYMTFHEEVFNSNYSVEGKEEILEPKL